MKMPIASRLIFYFVSIYLVLGSHIADWSSTHLLNPRWPPHAKFHTGQTLAFSILLSILTVYFASSKSKDKAQSIAVVFAFSSIYWLTQALAILYPNTAFMDPEFDDAAHRLFGIPPQLVVDIIAMSFVGLGTYLAARSKSKWT